MNATEILIKLIKEDKITWTELLTLINTIYQSGVIYSVSENYTDCVSTSAACNAQCDLPW